MATRKRTTRRTGLVGRAMQAGQQALRQAESRVPPDFRRQVERRITQGEKGLESAIKQVRQQVLQAAKQADVDKVLKRLDGLTKQVQQLARGAAARTAPAKRRATRTTKRAATKVERPAGTARRKAASTSKASSRKAASTRRTATRRAPGRRTSTLASNASDGSTSSTAGRAPRRAAARRAPSERRATTEAANETATAPPSIKSDEPGSSLS